MNTGDAAGRTERPRRARARLPLFLLLGAALVALFLVLWALVVQALGTHTRLGRDLGLSRSPLALLGLAEVTLKSYVTFPPHAVLLDGEFQGGLSQYIIAKISMPVSEVPQFVGQPPFSRKGGVSGTERAFTNADETAMVRRGWNPDSCKRFLSGKGTHGAPEFVRFVIDLDDPKTAIVYFEWDA